MDEKQRERETEADEADATRRVNPAMRHDVPRESGSGEVGAEREQVRPAQGEPLRPLDPGGIGG